MVTCADTSFLFSLYGNDANSPRAVAWAAQATQPVIITINNRFELSNALRFAEFRNALLPGEALLFLSQFENAIAQGRLVLVKIDLEDVMNEALRLSAIHTLTGGHRGFDILHVAAARLFHAQEFLTFDANQRKLALAEGILVPL